MYPAERGEEENEVKVFPFKDANTEILHTSFFPGLVTFAILAARNVGKHGFSLGHFPAKIQQVLSYLKEKQRIDFKTQLAFIFLAI